jgi:hypothetical protein
VKFEDRPHKTELAIWDDMLMHLNVHADGKRHSRRTPLRVSVKAAKKQNMCQETSLPLMLMFMKKDAYTQRCSGHSGF